MQEQSKNPKTRSLKKTKVDKGNEVSKGKIAEEPVYAARSLKCLVETPSQMHDV
jgi:hypothetical protein